ncbi:SpaA isopeptide-forming pilin-related protein [Butyrivibrio sp. NC2002]|uniref:SpaA isopeptide-forming pilin-related protein n=1 Tax=Butyrivibrio sp. NC2002 TaxID=1410610 RepID=UPI00068B7D77|nr:SpaA isopeptide-forming pilin-related protein [Butyrivibrio sp. NC2002]
MWGKNNIKADKYLRRHDTRKKWLSVMLCVALLTGTLSMYILNKPATAMTEEGAESIGVVMDKANAGGEDTKTDTGSSFWEPIPEEELPASNTEADSSENADAENTDNAGEASDNEDATAADSSEAASDAAATEGSESADATTTSEDAAAAEGSESADATTTSEDAAAAGDTSETASEDAAVATSDETQSAASDSADTSDSKVKESEDASDITDEIPESVDLAEYVTETIIERLNEDGEWEVITEEDIKDGDHLRVTLNYVMPKEVAASEDIHFELPEQYGKTIASESDLEDGNGNYEVTDDNQIKIQYSDDFKREVIEGEGADANSEEDDNSAFNAMSSFSVAGVLNYFFQIGRLDGILNRFVITAHAEGESVVRGSVTSESVVGDPGMYIEDVSIAKNPSEVWKDNKKTYSGGTKIQSGEQVDNGDLLLFTLSYRLNPGTISKDNTVVYYNLADYEITPYIGMGGDILNNNGEIIGSFDVAEDGMVTFNFRPNFAEKNNEQAVLGKFYFVAQATSDKTHGEDVKKYQFDNLEPFIIRINNDNKSNLSIQKKATPKTPDEDSIHYEIELSSDKGTGGKEIILNDVIKVLDENRNDSSITNNITLVSQLQDKGISVKLYKDYSGNYEAVNYGFTGTGNNGWNMTLPALEAGWKYVIEYDFKVPSDVIRSEKKVIVRNEAKSHYNDSNEKEASTENEYGTNPIPDIQKTGVVNPDGTRSVVWTVVLNSNNRNLKGYKISDTYLSSDGSPNNNSTIWQVVEVRPSSLTPTTTQTLQVGEKRTPGNKSWFAKDDYSCYVFTYTQKYTTDDLYYGALKNTAQISRDPGEENSSTAEVYVNEKFLDKVAGGLSGNDDGVVKATWNINLYATDRKPIKTDESDIEWFIIPRTRNYWAIHEELGDNQVFTNDDIKAIKNTIKDNFRWREEKYTTYRIEKGTLVTLPDGTQGYRSLTIKIYSNLTQNKTLTFTSTGYVGDGTKEATFKNTAWVYDRSFKGEAEQKYSLPTIEKYDGNNNSGDTEYLYSDTALFRQGILTWNIKANIPANLDETKYQDIYVIDTLPNDCTFIDNSIKYNDKEIYGLEVADNNSFNNAKQFTGGKATSNNVVYTATVEGNKVKISFDTHNAKGQTVFFRIRAKINDGVMTGSDDGEVVKKAFENSVLIGSKGNGDEPFGTDTQKQTITNTDTIITKDSYRPNDSANVVGYAIDINPNGDDLLNGSDVLELKDTLTAKSSSEFAAHLVIDSLEVVEITKDDQGNEVENILNNGDYSYTTDSYITEAEESQKYNEIFTITLKIPDKKHLRIRYRYSFSGEKDVTISISNKAELSGIAVENYYDDDSTELKIQEVGAIADVSGINLYKVDSESSTERLSGAKFKLYYYGKNAEGSGVWIEKPNSSNGGLYITASDGLCAIQDLTYNLAYKLVEVEAPKGYIKRDEPLYFLIKTSNNMSEFPLTYPAGFYSELNGKDVIPGDAVFFSNEKENTSIKVKKDWDDNNNQYGVRPSFIQVKISGSVGDEVTSTEENYYTVRLDHRYNRGQNHGIEEYTLLRVKKGGTVTFWPQLWKNDGGWTDENNEVIINGVKTEPNARKDSPDIKASSVKNGVYEEYTLQVNSDMNIIIYDCNQNYSYNMQYVVSAPDSNAKKSSKASDTVDGENALPTYEKTYNVTASDNWELTVSDLPKYKFIKDENGTEHRYVWNYTVTEVSNIYYSPEITESEQDGTRVVSIMNHWNNTPVYSLPSTGSTGTAPFTFGGLALLVISFIGISLNNKRQKQEDS